MYEELLPSKRPGNNNNRAQFENLDIEEEDKEGSFISTGGTGAQMLGFNKPMQRNFSPLIEEERPEPESQPHFLRRPKANLARQIYDSKQVAKKPWKKGMPFSKTTMKTFGSSNPRQAATIAANRPGGFQKLFGAKMSQSEIDDRNNAGRAPKESFWGRLKDAVTGGGRKRSWMEMFFGARRRPSNSARALGIASTNAPNGQSSGWADQLIDASKAGRLDPPEDKKEAFFSNPVPGAEAQPEQHQSSQSYDPHQSIEEEEKVPTVPLLTKQDAKRNSFFNVAYTQQQMQNQQENDDKAQDDDDLSIDESEDEEDEVTKRENQRLRKAYDSDEGDSPLSGHIRGIFQQSQFKF